MSNGTFETSMSRGVQYLFRSWGRMTLDAKQRRRQRVLLVALPGVVGLGIAAFGPERISFMFRLQFEVVVWAALLSTTVSVMALAGWYLQTGFSFKEEREQNEERTVTERDDRAAQEVAALREQLAALQSFASQNDDRFAKLEHIVERQMITGSDVTGTAIGELTNDVRKAVVLQAADDVIGELTRKIDAANESRNSAREIYLSFTTSRDRLVREVAALMRRGNLNLLMGSATTIAGVSLLAYFVINLKPQELSPAQFAIMFLPKVALVIFIEAFAYFFLKLYKTSLEEIKFYQNEITTIEQRYLALISSARPGMEKTYSQVVAGLGSTDRNPVAASASKEDLERERTFVQSAVEALKALAPAAKA